MSYLRELFNHFCKFGNRICLNDMIMNEKNLKPASVFYYFEEICQVPRPSKREEKIIAYLKAFGREHGLETKTDEVGNVLIKKPATPGKENLKTVILQSHIDMVCEKTVMWSMIF